MSIGLAPTPPGVHSFSQDRALGSDGAAVRASIEQAFQPPTPDRTAEILRRISAALKKGTDVEGVLVGVDTFGRLCDFLRALPGEVPVPEIVVESSRTIGLDWQLDRTHVLTVAVDDTPFVGFAALLGEEPLHGRTSFYGDVPETLAFLLRRLYPAARPQRLRTSRT